MNVYTVRQTYTSNTYIVEASSEKNAIYLAAKEHFGLCNLEHLGVLSKEVDLTDFKGKDNCKFVR